MRKHPLVLAALALLACSGEPDSPDTAVRATLAAIEAAAGERDVGAVEVHVSEAYADAQGHDKRAVVGVAALHLMRNQTVYTFSRIHTIDTSEPGSAQVQALVALAGRPIPDAAALATVRADLYRFDLRLREEEPRTWRVIAASWQPAALTDFR
jgi:hypothetical protein